MKIGKLYQVKKYFWLIYPSKDIATAAVALAPAVAPAVWELRAGVAAAHADYWSKKLNCNVSYIEPNSMFVLFERDGEYCKVLSTNGSIGWIILDDWYKDDIEEVKV
jgi:hypothetical protein